MINKNKFFRMAHIYLSLFFLPCALLYALTGMVYIFGINQDFKMQTQNYVLNKNIKQGEEIKTLIEFLKENNLELPSQKQIKLKNSKQGLSIGSIYYNASIIKNANDQYLISTQKRSLLGVMISLHKNKGEWYFSVLAVAFALSLFLLYISGLMISFFASKKDRSKQLVVFVLGVFSTLILAYLSL